MFEPGTETELVDAVLSALADGRKLAIRGGGSKAAVGRNVDATVLSTRQMTGIIDYDPAELILTVRPSTPLADVEAAIGERGQMLAFEPFDHGPLFGTAKGMATIGGVVAAGVAGSRRVTAGGARDHLLGFRAVSGRGESFIAGAKVVKNVTGYDLPKLAAGSWGRLFVLAEMTLKVLPRPEMSRSLAIAGLAPEQARQAMAAASGSHAEVAATAHVPGRLCGGESLTLFRLEGFDPSVAARAIMLQTLLADVGAVRELDEAESAGLWDGIRTLDLLPQDHVIWRINIPPRALAAIVDVLEPLGARWFADWAGGLIWTSFDGDPAVVREAAQRAGGHAMLLRAPEAVRAVVPCFHPQSEGLAALEQRVRRAFDPLSLFETGRF